MAWSIIPARCGVPIASRRRPNTQCTTGGLRAVSPSAPVPQRYSSGSGRTNLNAAELFSIYTEFRGLVALSRRGNQPARKVPRESHLGLLVSRSLGSTLPSQA